MTNFLAVLLVAICSSVACAQSGGDVELLNSSIPRPYASLGPSVTEDAGYAPLAYRAESGLDLESKHAIFRALAAYDNGHKTDDGDQPNVNGHDRYLESAAYFRAGHGWSFGMGWRWNQLSTANYSKGGSRPELGEAMIGSSILAAHAGALSRCVSMLTGSLPVRIGRMGVTVLRPRCGFLLRAKSDTCFGVRPLAFIASTNPLRNLITYPSRSNRPHKSISTALQILPSFTGSSPTWGKQSQRILNSFDSQLPKKY